MRFSNRDVVMMDYMDLYGRGVLTGSRSDARYWLGEIRGYEQEW